jgi:hypothetical protein
MNFLQRLILENLGLKVSALAIALALWAAYNSEPVVETGYSAPLLLVNMPDGLEVEGEVPATVRLRVRGRLARLRRLAPGEVSVSADCSLARAGSQRVKLEPNMAGVPYGTEIVGVTPPEIEISLVPGSAPPPERN